MGKDTYLVTGSSGFIGYNLCNYIIKRGHNVFGLDLDEKYNNLKKWRNEKLNKIGVKTFCVDISDKYQLDDFKNKNNASFKSIFHLAGLAGVRRSLEIPEKYYDANLRGTLNILNLASHINVDSLVFSSTSSVYGGNKNSSKETDNLNPISPYANSKLLAEKICKLYSISNNLNVSILRYFTVYGEAGRPDMSILRFIDNIFNGNPITIYGDGNQERDFTYIEDVCDATFKSSRLVDFNILNIGNSKPVKLNDIVNIIEKKLNKKAKIINEPKNNLDVFKTHADNSRAMNLLKWVPVFSIEKGIESTVNWYINNHNLIGKLS
ncbi:MAG: SDR family NAD(P)-dependent oxidoreductase [Chloroflexota bacterium]|nr:SDR family NAD(P)-dependent oxidoreductase [Chloroflexota bacterium]MEC8440209.1 SDR family NAD(P)-dependent oxidoreductase [Chloroflexota bacterium]MEC8750434.1 SDR family NAD(P)-dependent oxidoreductase [Chloroflexota bacterium]